MKKITINKKILLIVLIVLVVIGIIGFATYRTLHDKNKLTV